MSDTFASYATGLSAPAARHFAITAGPSDMAIRPRAIRCDVAGTATLEDEAGVSITYTLAAGEVLAFRAVKVTAATATLIGWY